MFREILYSKFQASGEAKAAKNLRAAGEVNNPTESKNLMHLRRQICTKMNTLIHLKS